jgi:hypothetical protein
MFARHFLLFSAALHYMKNRGPEVFRRRDAAARTPAPRADGRMIDHTGFVTPFVTVFRGIRLAGA